MEQTTIDLSKLSRERLLRMKRAAVEAGECQRVLKKAGLNLVGELLKGHDTFYEMNHYPDDDVFDADSQSQYYYHAHRPESGEHGHFHTFLRAPNMPPGIEPAPYHGSEPRPLGDDAHSHLVCISMDAYGDPRGLFAVNRWVTGETWYRAEDVIRMLDRFIIDHAYPSWPLNRWISAMIQLFHPQICELLRQRDRVVADWQQQHPDRDVYEDRELEVTGQLAISVDQQLARLESELQRR